MEAVACGPSVITYQTGGCPGFVSIDTGFVVEKGNIKAVLERIKEIRSSTVSYKSSCIKCVEKFLTIEYALIVILIYFGMSCNKFIKNNAHDKAR